MTSEEKRRERDVFILLIVAIVLQGAAAGFYAESLAEFALMVVQVVVVAVMALRAVV